MGFLLGEWEKGVHEIPDGSNDSPEIRKYGPPYKVAWCALYGTWGLIQAGLDILKTASCHGWIRYAKLKNYFYPIDSEDPKAWIPGNSMVFFWDGEHGHYTSIVWVSPDGQTVITVEGNKGNRVALVKHSIHEKCIVGTVNPFPPDEQPLDFERGTCSTKPNVNDSTR